MSVEGVDPWVAILLQELGYRHFYDVFKSCKSSNVPAPATRYPYNLCCRGTFLAVSEARVRKLAMIAQTLSQNEILEPVSGVLLSVCQRCSTRKYSG